MADPKIAIAATLIHEGGYVNNPADPGGATNMGVTQADMPGQDMKTLTVGQATEYYLQHYWKPLYSQIESQMIASKLFDMGVLFGVGTAVKQLQIAMLLTADGVFGPMTLAEVNRTDPPVLMDEFQKALHVHVENVVTRNPTLNIFLTGWNRRIDS
jgi:lysozyme family protein